MSYDIVSGFRVGERHNISDVWMYGEFVLDKIVLRCNIFYRIYIFILYKCKSSNYGEANARLYQISIFKESSCISVILNDWCNDLLFQLQFSCNFGHLSRLSIFKLSQFVRIVWRETFLKQNIFHCARKWAMYLNRP